MKKQFIILTALIITTIVFVPRQSNAQAPEQMKYQAVARDNAGNVISNQLISFRISILQGSSAGTSVYSETHSLTTNDFGLANLNIGSGTIVSGTFSSIDWSSDLYFLQVEMDESGGTAYQLMGTSQLLSVPYALHAKTADSLTHGLHNLSDVDGDTKIQVEKNPNEDMIRFDIGGTEQWIMTETRIEPQNSGGSVFIGEGAGANDDLSDNRNVAIGVAALEENTDRSSLVAIGDSALYNNGIGVTSQFQAIYNTALGSKSLFSNTTGYGNTASGFESLYNNINGIKNTANGSYSLSSNIDGSWNCAVGYKALKNNTTGSGNIAVGSSALEYNTTGNSNVATGGSALLFNETGHSNSAYGSYALAFNEGNSNTAIGYNSMYFNQTGYSNTAIGAKALNRNTTRSNLVAVGDSALYNNGVGATGSYQGWYNTAVGSKSLYSNTTGSYNTANGYRAIFLNNAGTHNTATGAFALHYNTSGSYNTASGHVALFFNSTGDYNTAIGRAALNVNTSGHSNTAVGVFASEDNTTGYENTAVGREALDNTNTAGRCVAVGYQAGSNNITGFYTTAVGWRAGPTSSNIKNSTALGRGAATTATNQIRIGNSIVTSIGGYEPWSNVSDKRFKTEVREDIVGLGFIMALQPVSYQLDLEEIDRFTGYAGPPENETDEERQFDLESRAVKEQIRKTGFIAQDVEQAALSVSYDFSGVDKPKNENDFYGLRYAEFVVPLVKAVQEQQELINALTEENQQMKDDLAQIKSMLNNNVQK